MVFTKNKTMVALLLFTTAPIGSSPMNPALAIGVRRYTDNTSRHMGYDLLTGALSLASIVSGASNDTVRSALDGPLSTATTVFSVNRILILSAAIMNAIAAIVTVFLPATEVEERKKQQVDPWVVIKECFTKKKFYRFLAVSTIMIGLKMTLRHLVRRGKSYF